MRILLDTCTFLWIIAEPDKLSAKARESYSDTGNEVFLSSVSCWEMAVKYAAGRLPLPEPPAQFVPVRRQKLGILPLPLDEEASLHSARLPKLHADPFDRMLVCQAITHGLAVLSPDDLIAQYPVRIVW
jgi:PIN domain nuclease of toxin-antitoxin system